MASFSHLALLSPLPLTTPPHHSDPTHPSSHHSPLYITSLHSPHPYSHQCTPPFTPLLLTTSPHYILSPLPLLLPLATPHHPHHPSPPLTTPHHPSPPLTTPHHPSSPLLTTPPHHTTLFTTLFLTYLPNHTPLHHPLHPSPHHSYKGNHNTKGLVKSYFSMSLNLCRTFLSLKTSFLIIFCKKNFWDKIDQKLEYDGSGGAHVLNGARATLSIHFSTCNILPLKKTLISHFRVLLCLINFCCYFSHVPRDNKSHLQKESGPKVLLFSWNLALRRTDGGGMTHITRL